MIKHNERVSLQHIQKAKARNDFDRLIEQVKAKIAEYESSNRAEQPLCDLHVRLFAAEQYARENMMLLFDKEQQ